MEVKNKLNPKKLAFIKAYTTLGAPTYRNGSASARLAGYSPHSSNEIACKLIKQPLILDAIQQAERIAWDWDFARWSQEVVTSVEQVPATHSNRPRYYELIAKSKGWLTDKTQVNNNLYLLGTDDLSAIRSALSQKLAESRKIGNIIGRTQQTETRQSSQVIDITQDTSLVAE